MPNLQERHFVPATIHAAAAASVNPVPMVGILLTLASAAGTVALTIRQPFEMFRIQMERLDADDGTGTLQILNGANPVTDARLILAAGGGGAASAVVAPQATDAIDDAFSPFAIGDVLNITRVLNTDTVGVRLGIFGIPRAGAALTAALQHNLKGRHFVNEADAASTVYGEPGQVVGIVIDVPAALASPVLTFLSGFELLDLYIIKKAAGGGAETLTVTNTTAGGAITNAINVNINDQLEVQYTTLTTARCAFSAGDVMTLTRSATLTAYRVLLVGIAR
jgi:hypothetical protein